MIKVQNIRKQIDDLEVLLSVTFTINKGEMVSILGAYRAVKTTVLQILVLLDSPVKNNNFQLAINGTNVLQLKEQELAAFRNKNLGFIFQFHQLLPEFTALENVCIPAFVAGKSKIEAEKDATELLEYLG